MTNVLEYLEQSARQFPDKAAVEDPDGRCTYRELMESAKRIGSALSRVCPARMPVAVFMDKSVAALKAFLGIVYAGCFYIFISPDQPNRRIEQILTIANAGCIVTGYAEGIYDGIITDQKHAVCVIMNETDKMTALVDVILCLSRIESGETELCIEDISVEAVMNNCLVSLESVVIKKGIEVKTDIAGGTVQADAAQMETAVMNLLANAVKYADQRIAICYDKKRLIIWNDGSGITDEDAPHVFERFYIGKNGNTGIGLALTKEIIERHGWRICADTADGGTRFIVRFSRF